MVIAWIVITLMLALLIAIMAAGMSDDSPGITFAAAFFGVIQISLFLAVIFIAAHFIQKFW